MSSAHNHEDYRMSFVRTDSSGGARDHDEAQRPKKRNIDDFLASPSDPPLPSNYNAPAAAGDQVHSSYKSRMQEPGQNDSKNVQSTAHHRKAGLTGSHDSTVSTGDDLIEVEHEELKSSRKTSASNEETAIVDDSCLQDEKRIGSNVEMSKKDVLSQWAMKYLEDPGLPYGPIFPYWKDQPDDLEAFHETQKVACQRVKGVAKRGGNSMDLAYVNSSFSKGQPSPTASKFEFKLDAG